jgi:exonuclease VII small subunit
VDRLVTLKSIHDDSLDMNARVKKVEQSSETLAHLLETDTALLENIEKSLEENVKIFQSNMQTLDERMTKLLQSRS